MFKKLLRKKQTKSNIVQFFKPEKCSKNCKVIHVNNDLSLIILLEYKGETFKWNFKLEHIPFMDVIYFRTELEKLVLYKSFRIEVLDFLNGYIIGFLHDDFKKTTINKIFWSFISTYETKNNNFKKRFSNYISTPLETVFEEKETHF